MAIRAKRYEYEIVETIRHVFIYETDNDDPLDALKREAGIMRATLDAHRSQRLEPIMGIGVNGLIHDGFTLGRVYEVAPIPERQTDD